MGFRAKGLGLRVSILKRMKTMKIRAAHTSASLSSPQSCVCVFIHIQICIYICTHISLLFLG